MLFANSCRCSVGGETIRLPSQSSRVRYPYSVPLFFSFFNSPSEVVSSVYMFPFFFATHHPFQQQMHTTKSIAKKSPTGSLPPAVPLAITPTFRPWTHTFDDSYIYQLSLVVATATVSYAVGVSISAIVACGILDGCCFQYMRCSGTAKSYQVRMYLISLKRVLCRNYVNDVGIQNL